MTVILPTCLVTGPFIFLKSFCQVMEYFQTQVTYHLGLWTTVWSHTTLFAFPCPATSLPFPLERHPFFKPASQCLSDNSAIYICSLSIPSRPLSKPSDLLTLDICISVILNCRPLKTARYQGSVGFAFLSLLLSSYSRVRASRDTSRDREAGLVIWLSGYEQ